MEAFKQASRAIQKAAVPKWKQEIVSDHKFDFIDIEEFRKFTFVLVVQYFILLCNVAVSLFLYGADIWTACILLIYDRWSMAVQPKIPLHISKWIYVGCIGISFLLLAWEVNKTKGVMATRDVSLAVANPLAYRTYSVKSYSYFCLLYKVKNSTKWSDVLIFYIFYTLKGWKRILLAEGPRQMIVCITLYALVCSASTDQKGNFEFSNNLVDYGHNWQQRLSVVLMGFTCILWIISFINITISAIFYFFILCLIRGNLKEYCCHKIDKRIDEILLKQRKKRIRNEEKEKNYAASVSSKKSKKLNNHKDTESTPTLPTLPVFDDATLYASEQQQRPWPYQHTGRQDSFQYKTQQAPLECYSPQRNPTNNYIPYAETPRLPYQPPQAYETNDSYANYYYNSPTNSQHSNTIANPNYPQNSASNLHEYQRSNTYDSYTVAQSGSPLHNNTTNHNDDSSSQTQILLPCDQNVSAYHDQQSYDNLSNKGYSNDDHSYHNSDPKVDEYYNNQDDYSLENTKEYHSSPSSATATTTPISLHPPLSNTTYTNYI